PGVAIRSFAAEDMSAFRARALAGADRKAIATAQSDGEGKFRIDAAPAATEVLIESTLVEAVDGEDVGVVVLSKTTTRATITSAGKPLANAVVLASSYARRSDANGVIELSEIPQRVWFFHPDYGFSETVTFGAPGPSVQGRVIDANG